jgi:hypothetical protein
VACGVSHISCRDMREHSAWWCHYSIYIYEMRSVEFNKHMQRTSCAIKEARSRNFTPPGTLWECRCPTYMEALWVQGGAGLGWVWSGGSNLAAGPLGSVAGDPDRHRAPGLAPLPLLRTPYWRLPAGG